MFVLTASLDKKNTFNFVFFGEIKSGRINGVVVITWRSYGGVPLYIIIEYSRVDIFPQSLFFYIVD